MSKIPPIVTFRSRFKQWETACGVKSNEVKAAIQKVHGQTKNTAEKNYAKWLGGPNEKTNPGWQAKLFGALCNLEGFKIAFGEEPLSYDEQKKPPETVLEERTKGREAKRKALRGEETSAEDVSLGVARDALYSYFASMDVRLTQADGRGDWAVARQLTHAVAIAHETSGNWSEAARHFEQLAEWCVRMEEPVAAVKAQLRQGLALYRCERFEPAAQCLKSLLTKIDDNAVLKSACSPRLEAEMCDYLAMSLLRLNQELHEARQLLQKRSGPLWRKLQSPLGVAAWQHRLALVLMGMGGAQEMQDAKEHLLDGLETRLRLRADTECGRSLNNLAIWHYQRKEFLQARMILLLCDLLQTCSKDDAGRMKTSFYLGRVYVGLLHQHARDADQDNELVHDIDDRLQFTDDRERELISRICEDRHRRTRKRGWAIRLHLPNAIHYFKECIEIGKSSPSSLIVKQAESELSRLTGYQSASKLP